MSSLKNLTVMVKSFMRPQMVARFLVSVGEYQKQRNIAFGSILIADDSDEETKNEIRKIVAESQSDYPELNIVYQDLEFYLGCAEGRNRMIDQIKTEYFLYCDDDYIFDVKCNIEECVSLADEKQLDILSGWWKNYPELDAEWHVQNFVGNFDLSDPDCINCYINVHELYNFKYADYHTNYYVGRSEKIRKLRWEPTLKTEEHPEFFFRAYKANLKMAFTNKLFIGHNHPKGDAKYESFRSVNFNAGRKALYHRLDLCGVKKWNAFYFGKNNIRQWTVDRELRTSTYYSFGLSNAAITARDNQSRIKPCYNLKVPIKRLTHEFENYFFGYFDIQAADKNDELHLGLHVPFFDRQPKADEIAEIQLIDKNGGTTLVDKVETWNFQQGAFAQFRPSHNDEVIYNTYNDEFNCYGSTIKNIKSGATKVLPMPLANVSRDGKFGLGLNFSRLYDYRPGYGYSNIIDPFYHDIAPQWDGIWLVDLERRKNNLLISYKELWEQFFEGTKWENNKVIVNHANFNPSGTRIFALLRVFSDSAPFPTISIVVDVKTKEAKRVFGFGSHYHWKNDSEIIVSGEDVVERNELTGMSLYHINCDSGVVSPIDKAFFRGDGHCTYSPDGRFILYDSYCSIQVPYRKLQIYDLLQKRGTTLCYLYSDPLLYKEDNDCRCDLHPRWSPSGKYISFDSMHEGFRGIYQIKVEDAVRVLNSEISNEPQLALDGSPIIKEKDLVSFVRRDLKPTIQSNATKAQENRSSKPSDHHIRLRWIERARKYYDEGKYSMALSVIETTEMSSNKIKNMHSVLFLKSKILQALDKIEDAVKLAYVLATEAGTNGLYQRHLRNLFNQKGDFEAAIKPAIAATLIESNDAGNFLYLSRLLFKIGRYEDALNASQEALQVTQKNDLVFDAMFDAAKKLGNEELALTAIKKAIALKPGNKTYIKKLRLFEK